MERFTQSKPVIRLVEKGVFQNLYIIIKERMKVMDMNKLPKMCYALDETEKRL